MGPAQKGFLFVLSTHGEALAFDEFILQIVQGRSVELKLPLEGAIGQASPALEQGNRLVQHLQDTGIACASGGPVDLITALNTINIQLQGTNNDGLIGTCESAVTSTPVVGSCGADVTFYTDPLNLLSYFANYQVLGTMLLIEAYHYQTFQTYTGPTLAPAQTAQLCLTPDSNCLQALFYLQQLYVYLQNQYSVNGVPYSTTDANNHLLTGLYLADSSTSYLLVASLEDFTSTVDPAANCASPLTAANPYGLAAQNGEPNASFPATAV